MPGLNKVMRHCECLEEGLPENKMTLKQLSRTNFEFDAPSRVFGKATFAGTALRQECASRLASQLAQQSAKYEAAAISASGKFALEVDISELRAQEK